MKPTGNKIEIEDFAKEIHELLKSNRDVNIGVAGMTGEGKSTLTIQLLKAYSKINPKYWDFNKITWSRKELMEWIDGKGKDKKGRLPRYSGILIDELFHMFYSRTWFDVGQIDAISTLNMCRDRRLFIMGNVPVFWQLDKSLLTRFRFYIYVPTGRTKALVFQQTEGAFVVDPWNIRDNSKLIGKELTSKNYIGYIEFDGLSKEEEDMYLNIRNEKRVKAIAEMKGEREKYKDIKAQRDCFIRAYKGDRKDISKAIKKIKGDPFKQLIKWSRELSNKDLGDVGAMSFEAIRLICNHEL